jgi:hypothetical protein
VAEAGANIEASAAAHGGTPGVHAPGPKRIIQYAQQPGAPIGRVAEAHTRIGSRLSSRFIGPALPNSRSSRLLLGRVRHLRPGPRQRSFRLYIIDRREDGILLAPVGEKEVLPRSHFPREDFLSLAAAVSHVTARRSTVRFVNYRRSRTP